jgi:ATP-dependent RNA helicase DeaD
VADLRHRRLELTRASLREAVVAGGLEPYRNLVAELSSELDPMDVAAAAVKLAHEAGLAEAGAQADEQDVPSAPVPEREFPASGARKPFRRAPGELAPERATGRGARPARGSRAEPGERAGRGRSAGMVRLFVGVGRIGGMRPGDLVGAIANEAGLSGGEIGGIQISDRFSLVEVPEERAQEVIRALRGTKLRGQKVSVRYDRDTVG